MEAQMRENINSLDCQSLFVLCVRSYTARCRKKQKWTPAYRSKTLFWIFCVAAAVVWRISHDRLNAAPTE